MAARQALRHREHARSSTKLTDLDNVGDLGSAGRGAHWSNLLANAETRIVYRRGPTSRKTPTCLTDGTEQRPCPDWVPDGALADQGAFVVQQRPPARLAAFDTTARMIRNVREPAGHEAETLTEPEPSSRFDIPTVVRTEGHRDRHPRQPEPSRCRSRLSARRALWNR